MFGCQHVTLEGRHCVSVSTSPSFVAKGFDTSLHILIWLFEPFRVMAISRMSFTSQHNYSNSLYLVLSYRVIWSQMRQKSRRPWQKWHLTHPRYASATSIMFKDHLPERTITSFGCWIRILVINGTVLHFTLQRKKIWW